MDWKPEVAAFLDEPRFGVLATINPDGSAHQTVMWYRRDGGDIVMNTRKGRVKPNNLDRDPRASLCIEDGQRYLTVSGRVEIDENRERGLESMRVMTEHYEGAERAAELIRDEYANQHRIELRLVPDAVDAHGF
ncbi:MAG: PPOX class F420-dependent oxidoreductase [Thermomicrobiales bacterium]|nr:PPOX class F420-dependent oxidoreductase [Thermomicrobiales bacterium]